MLTIFLQATPSGSMTTTMIMMAVMFVGFYFLMIRPQMQKQKKEKQFVDSLKPGTRVVLTSGLHGKVVQIMEDGVIIETMSGKQKYEKAAVSREFTQNRFPETKTDTKK